MGFKGCYLCVEPQNYSVNNVSMLISAKRSYLCSDLKSSIEWHSSCMFTPSCCHFVQEPGQPKGKQESISEIIRTCVPSAKTCVVCSFSSFVWLRIFPLFLPLPVVAVSSIH